MKLISLTNFILPLALAGRKKPSGPQPIQLSAISAKFHPSETQKNAPARDCPGSMAIDGRTPEEYKNKEDENGNVQYVIREAEQPCGLAAVSEEWDDLRVTLDKSIKSVTSVEIWPSLEYMYWVQWYSYTTQNVQVCSKNDFSTECVPCSRNKKSRPEGIEGQYLGMEFKCPEDTTGRFIKAWLDVRNSNHGFRSVLGLTEVKIFGFAEESKPKTPTPVSPETPTPVSPETPSPVDPKPVSPSESPVDPNPVSPNDPANQPKYEKKCNKIASKRPFCKVFEICNYKPKNPMKDRCAGSCHATLDYSNWPEEGCGKKFSVEIEGEDAKVCKGKNKKKKCYDFRGYE